MRKRALQRKVEEPDFMRKREVLSLNEALNVDRDMDYIAHKPLADEEKWVYFKLAQCLFDNFKFGVSWFSLSLGRGKSFICRSRPAPCIT